MTPSCVVALIRSLRIASSDSEIFSAVSAIALVFSTVFVARAHRRAGVASALLARGERWMLDHGMTKAATYTDEGNTKVQRLFVGHGYSIRSMPENFVALSKVLVRVRPAA